MNHTLLPPTANAQLPARYEAAKLALSECFDIDECKDWSDKAKALASYAKQSQDNELEKHAMRIRARAVRRCGELLKEIEKSKPGPKELEGSTAPQLSPRKEAAAQAGLSPDQAKRSIRVANVPAESFEEQVESEQPPTVTKLAEQGKQAPKTPPVPIYEKQGMSKQQFQAGMYLAGALETYLKEARQFSPADVMAGRTDAERESLRKLIEEADTYHDQLIAKL